MAVETRMNLVTNGSFSAGQPGGLPEGWEVKSSYEFLTPVFELVESKGKKVLQASGAGNPDCLGWLTTSFSIEAGKTYKLKAKFSFEGDVNPHQNLIFAFYQDQFNEGILNFKRLSDNSGEGEKRFFLPGEGTVNAEVRIYFRYNADGKVHVEEISVEECEPIQPRLAKVVATHGKATIEQWQEILDVLGASKPDVVLLPETFNGLEPEPLDGPCGTLMSSYAAKHKMYVSGTFKTLDAKANRVYNIAVLYDRNGKLVGQYYKNHPYSPEAFEGVTPGTEVPVFDTDFGRIGMMICYDSWFNDVAELLALKGAEIILFPSAGYSHSMMPARSGDNGTRVVASSEYMKAGIWDTSGREVTRPDVDTTLSPNCKDSFNDVVQRKIGPIEVIEATFDLTKCPSPHNWGGPMLSAPGGRRNRRDQKKLLFNEIEQEVLRWWDE